VLPDYREIGLSKKGPAAGYDPTGESPMRYTVVLELEADGGYVASVPALPGCVSQGDDRAEALANIREAIELYDGLSLTVSRFGVVQE
jgi:hypothetical protein